MELYGLEGAHPYVKKLTGTSLWEIRILGGDSIRIFYVTMKIKTFFLLHAFKKKSQKTPSKELARRVKTTQSVISRLEQGESSPSISFLKRVAAALNTTLQVQFK